MLLWKLKSDEIGWTDQRELEQSRLLLAFSAQLAPHGDSPGSA